MNIRNFLIQKIGRIIPDKVWIQIKYRQWFGKWANLRNPLTYNEKLNWIKLNDRRPEYMIMVDKYEAKRWISDKIGSEYIIPVVGGPWNSFDEIDFNKLPKSFVLKTTHDCGGVVICKNKKKLNLSEVKKFINNHLKNNYYLTNREWPYKNVKPRIFAEKYMSDSGKLTENNSQLTDYKFFCFDGKPMIMFIATDRNNSNEETKFDFFDMEFKHLPIIQGHPNSNNKIEKPRNFDLMKKLSEKISKGFPEIRVDFYQVDGKIYVGELTLFHFGGCVPFKPEEWDKKLGEYINL